MIVICCVILVNSCQYLWIYGAAHAPTIISYMYIYIYMYIHLCIQYICIYICVYVYMYAFHIYTGVYLCIYIHTCTCTYASILKNNKISIFLDPSLYIYTIFRCCINMYVEQHFCMYWVYIYIYVCTLRERDPIHLSLFIYIYM